MSKEQSEFELQMQRLHSAEIALESALEQTKAVRMALVEAFTSSWSSLETTRVAASAETPELEIAVASRVNSSEPKSVNGQPGKRRARCVVPECKTLHWNKSDKNWLCNDCYAAQNPTLPGVT